VPVRDTVPVLVLKLLAGAVKATVGRLVSTTVSVTTALVAAP
jgi:hypothetical protein